jgi:hypothetical protein
MPKLRIPDGGLTLDGLEFKAGEVDVTDNHWWSALYQPGADVLESDGLELPPRASDPPKTRRRAAKPKPNGEADGETPP